MRPRRRAWLHTGCGVSARRRQKPPQNDPKNRFNLKEVQHEVHH